MFSENFRKTLQKFISDTFGSYFRATAYTAVVVIVTTLTTLLATASQFDPRVTALEERQAINDRVHTDIYTNINSNFSSTQEQLKQIAEDVSKGLFLDYRRAEAQKLQCDNSKCEAEFDKLILDTLTAYQESLN